MSCSVTQVVSATPGRRCEKASRLGRDFILAAATAFDALPPVSSPVVAAPRGARSTSNVSNAPEVQKVRPVMQCWPAQLPSVPGTTERAAGGLAFPLSAFLSAAVPDSFAEVEITQKLFSAIVAEPGSVSSGIPSFLATYCMTCAALVIRKGPL